MIQADYDKIAKSLYAHGAETFVIEQILTRLALVHGDDPGVPVFAMMKLTGLSTAIRRAVIAIDCDPLVTKALRRGDKGAALKRLAEAPDLDCVELLGTLPIPDLAPLPNIPQLLDAGVPAHMLRACGFEAGPSEQQIKQLLRLAKSPVVERIVHGGTEEAILQVFLYAQPEEYDAAAEVLA